VPGAAHGIGIAGRAINTNPVAADDGGYGCDRWRRVEGRRIAVAPDGTIGRLLY
jgi:hypothetical protein